MGLIFKRGESRVTFCTVKCISTGEGFHTKETKERAGIFHGIFMVQRRTVKTATYRIVFM